MSNKAYIRGANASFATPNENLTCEPGGCYRIILLRHLGLRPKEDDTIRRELTFALGHAHETAISNILTRAEYQVEQERSIEKNIQDNIYFGGHIDLTTYKDDQKLLWELKSVSSISSYQKYVVKDDYKLNNLAQLVAYMLVDETPNGMLVYSNFIYAPAAKELKTSNSWEKIAPKIKKYEVTIDHYDILVNNVKLSNISVQNSLTHMLKSAQILKDQEVSKIPLANEAKVCFFCKYSQVCKQFNSGEITESKWFNSVELLSEKEGE